MSVSNAYASVDKNFNFFGGGVQDYFTHFAPSQSVGGAKTHFAPSQSVGGEKKHLNLACVNVIRARLEPTAVR